MAMPDYSEFTQEQIDAEREAIAREYAALDAAKTRTEADVLLGAPLHMTATQTVSMPPEVVADVEAAAEPEPEAAPWPHDHLVFGGMDLEVIKPNDSALIAVSMIGLLDGDGGLQVSIFNEFIAAHLSKPSLAKVIIAMTKPDAEVDLQGLVQALVNLRSQK